jgi:hypothetical protein
MRRTVVVIHFFKKVLVTIVYFSRSLQTEAIPLLLPGSAHPAPHVNMYSVSDTELACSLPVLKVSK